MKKSLFVALSAIVAGIFVGCNNPEPNPQPTDVQISIKQGDKVTIGIDKEKQLKAIVKPVGTKVVWESSDPTIVTVDNIGIVKGLAIGEATITVSAGEKKATCAVTVIENSDIVDFELNDYGLFGSEPQMIPGTEGWVHLTSGDSLYCQLGTIYLRVWDNGLTFVNGKGFTGEGFHIMGEVPVYWIMEGEMKGYYIGNSKGFFIDTLGTSEYKPYTMKAADVDVQMYGDYWKGYMAYAQDTTLAKPDGNLYLNSQPGTTMTLYWPEEDDATSWYLANIRYLNVNKVEVDSVTGAEELRYTMKVDWYDYFSAGYWYGLKATTVEEDGKTYITGIVEPYDMHILPMEYGNMEEEEEEETAEVYFIGDQSRVHLGEMPWGNRHLDNTIMYRK